MISNLDSFFPPFSHSTLFILPNPQLFEVKPRFVKILILTILFSNAQGLMFGYATDETEECMPLTVKLAHDLNRKLSDLRRNGTLWWARPDTKTQVTCEYRFENGACIPTRVHTVVVSTQHSEKVSVTYFSQLHCRELSRYYIHLFEF